MIVYYSPWMHRPSISEPEPQGWIMNWMTDHLAFYQFRELESTERFGEQIFSTVHFNERILEFQYSKKKCHFPSLTVAGLPLPEDGRPLFVVWSAVFLRMREDVWGPCCHTIWHHRCCNSPPLWRHRFLAPFSSSSPHLLGHSWAGASAWLFPCNEFHNVSQADKTACVL